MTKKITASATMNVWTKDKETHKREKERERERKRKKKKEKRKRKKEILTHPYAVLDEILFFVFLVVIHQMDYIFFHVRHEYDV